MGRIVIHDDPVGRAFQIIKLATFYRPPEHNSYQKNQNQTDRYQ
jgi:hypothetical protein